MKKIIILFAAVLLIASISCSTKEDAKPKSMTAPEAPKKVPASVDLPSWVLVPQVEGDAIVSARCVPFSGNISIDQSELTARGRAAIVKQIQVRAQVLDKTFEEKVSTSGKVRTGSTFSSVSKQVADQNLSGSRLVKVEFGMVNGVQQICGLVAIDKNSQKVFEELISGSNTEVSAQDKDILYQEFKAYKAQQELDEALGN